MKKLLLIVLSGMGIVVIGILVIRTFIYFFPVKSIPTYNVEQNVVAEMATAPIPVTVKPKPKPKPKPKLFKCDNRKHCSQMRSYEEAKYFNDHCFGTKMDGDNDGIPCERQFGKRY